MLPLPLLLPPRSNLEFPQEYNPLRAGALRVSALLFSMLHYLLRLFSKKTTESSPSSPLSSTLMNHLIVGLGNIGAEYAHTRHNIGFDVVDYLAAQAGATWEDRRYGFVTTVKVKNQTLILLKPSTYMNLSGNAVRYWLREKNIPVEQMLVVVDDLALPFGKLRIKGSGSEAGHNGLRHITQILGTQKYARLRFGIGNDFPKGGQVDFVLGHFEGEDLAQMPEALQRAAEAVKSYALQGIDRTMNLYNK